MSQSIKKQLKYIITNSILRMSTKRLWRYKEGVMDSFHIGGVRVGRKASERRYNLSYALKDKWIPLGWKEGNNISGRENNMSREAQRKKTPWHTHYSVRILWGLDYRVLESGMGRKLQQTSLKERLELWLFLLKSWSLLGR